MKIAVLYICTGHYTIFWKDFYRTAEKCFYPREQKHYFLITDNNDLIASLKENDNVTPCFQVKSGWPYDTLLRFNIFCTVQDRLLQYDFCYYCNANMLFLKQIDETVIPFPTPEKSLLLWRHTLVYHDEDASGFTVERNPESSAYIAEGEKCHPYGGGFFGGTSEAFVRMSRILRDNIAADLEKNIIAVWHDESHIQRYGTGTSCIEVPENTIVSEEYASGRNPYAIFLDKSHFGGNDKLRGLPFAHRVRNRAVRFVNRVCNKISRMTKNKGE